MLKEIKYSLRLKGNSIFSWVSTLYFEKNINYLCFDNYCKELY